MSGFLGVPVDAAYHLVLALTRLFTPVAGGLAAAVAIVAFTIAVRLLIWPLTVRALRGQAAMARLAPAVRELSARYGRSQPERFQRELAALYRREGASPFGGFLPLLAQWPFLSVTYLLFRSATVHGAPNALLSDGLFGVPLGAHWLSGGGLASLHDVLFLAVFAALAGVCWLSARLAKRNAPAASAPASGRGTGGAASAARKPKPAGPGGQAEAGAAGNGRAAGALTALLPYVTVAFAAFAPLAAGLYLLTTVGWSAGERALFQRRHQSPRTAGTAPENRT